MITYPATSEYFSKNRHEALQRMVDKMMKYTACVLSLSGLAFAFFASDIVHLIYGSEFSGSVLPLQVLLVGTVTWGVVISIGGSITGAGRPDLGMKLVAISALTIWCLILCSSLLWGSQGRRLPRPHPWLWLQSLAFI